MIVGMTSTHQNQNDRPSDQAPATDPAHDALGRILNRDALTFHEGYTIDAQDADIATIRDALADRITADEACAWVERLNAPQSNTDAVAAERALIARLGRIADRETGR